MFGNLSQSRYINLTTFRQDGSEASTPVWVVSDDDRRLLVWTGATTWKAKRIRRDPNVLVAASDFNGNEKGPRIAGVARFLDNHDAPLIQKLLRSKYGWQKKALDLQARLARLRRPATQSSSVYIEIRAIPRGADPQITPSGGDGR